MILGFHCAESSHREFSSEILLNITKITVFWDVVLWTVVSIYPSGGTYCRKGPPKRWIIYSTAWHHIPEGGNSHSRCCENLRILHHSTRLLIVTFEAASVMRDVIKLAFLLNFALHILPSTKYNGPQRQWVECFNICLVGFQFVAICWAIQEPVIYW